MHTTNLECVCFTTRIQSVKDCCALRLPITSLEESVDCDGDCDGDGDGDGDDDGDGDGADLQREQI